jgi:hypothetical protein
MYIISIGESKPRKDDNNYMKKIFHTAGAIAVAGLALAACGSAVHSHNATSRINKPAKSNTSTVPAKYGWKRTAAGAPELILPHVGKATPTIYLAAEQDYPYYTHLANPKDWVKSKTFGRHIFVGPYTAGVNYQRVRDAKIAAMDSMELLTASSNYQAAWPTTANGFNYRAFGQEPILQAALTSLNKSAVAQGHAAMNAVVPNETTIIESPVGRITAKQMAATATQPQNSTIGICVPARFEAVYSNRGGYAVPSTAFGVSPSDIYFADYGSTNTIIPTSPALTNGVGTNATSSCANFS